VSLHGTTLIQEEERLGCVIDAIDQAAKSTQHKSTNYGYAFRWVRTRKRERCESSAARSVSL